jgi:hypothetical protein
MHNKLRFWLVGIWYLMPLSVVIKFNVHDNVSGIIIMSQILWKMQLSTHNSILLKRYLNSDDQQFHQHRQKKTSITVSTAH